MKLLLSGYYGFGNLGDEALLAGLLSGLKAAGHEVTVLSGNPAQTRQLHGVRASSRYAGALGALIWCDAFVSGGGGLLQDKTSRRSLSYYLGLISLAKRLGKQTFVYGQSVGPLSERGRRRVASALKGVRVFVRDEASKNLLASLDIAAQLTADGALLLEPPPAKLSPRAPVLFLPRYGYPDVTDAFIYAARQLVERGISVAATSVQPGEDGAELTRLCAAVPELTSHTPASPAALLAVIGDAGYVVSARLHGLVLAAVAGVPFSGVVYDPKVAAFLKETGAPAFHLPPNARALLRAALDQPEVAAKTVENLKLRARTGLDDLLTELGKKT